MNRPTCAGCKAIIRWLTTRAGKAMPVDPDRLTEWLVTRDEAPEAFANIGPGTARLLTLVTPEGHVITGYQGSVLTPGAHEVVGYVPHWATCPKAKDFKR